MVMSNLLHELNCLRKNAKRTMNLMVGVPEYETYLAHIKEKHPEKTPMTYAEFFRERQDARYNGKVGKCC